MQTEGRKLEKVKSFKDECPKRPQPTIWPQCGGLYGHLLGETRAQNVGRIKVVIRYYSLY